jgi:peptide deformylase
MVARRLVKWPNHALLKTSVIIETFDESVVQFAIDLRDTMKVNHGAGLAGTQIGETLAGCILAADYVPTLPADPNVPNVVFFGNPTIEFMTNKVYRWEEACLSVDDIAAKVNRCNKIRLTYRNTNGSPLEVILEGSAAAAVQHETDHLFGKLFIHRLEGITKNIVTRKLRKISLKKRAITKLENSKNSTKKRKKRRK